MRRAVLYSLGTSFSPYQNFAGFLPSMQNMWSSSPAKLRKTSQIKTQMFISIWTQRRCVASKKMLILCTDASCPNQFNLAVYWISCDEKQLFDQWKGLKWSGRFFKTNIFIVACTLVSPKKYFAKNLELCESRH